MATTENTALQAMLTKMAMQVADDGSGRSLEELMKSNDPLKSKESQRLRLYFTSNYMNPDHDLDSYGTKLLSGDLVAVQTDFTKRVANNSKGEVTPDAAKQAAAQEIYELQWGPTRVPVYGLLLLATIITPSECAQILQVTRWLIDEAKVPVNGPDLSGTTAIAHSISTKPSFDPEFAQILYDAGGDVTLRNRYGETAVSEACKIWEPRRSEKATAAIEWYLSHGGNLDIKDNDGISPRVIMDSMRTKYMQVGGSAVAAFYKMVEKEDKRRRDLGDKCCTFCGLEGSLLVCSRCRSARYCRPPKNCQRGDWPNHKAACKKP